MGVGRPGTLHAFEHNGVAPDLVAFGKVLGGGLPLSAPVGPADVLDESAAAALLTTAGNPICTAAGRAVLRRITQDDLPSRSARAGRQLQDHLKAFAANGSDAAADRRHPGRGLAIGVDLVTDRETLTGNRSRGQDSLSGLAARGRRLLRRFECARGDASETISDDEVDLAASLVTEAITTLLPAWSPTKWCGPTAVGESNLVNPWVGSTRPFEERKIVTRHHFDSTKIHHNWDRDTPAALHIASGDVVDYELVMAGHQQIHEHSTAADVDLDFDTLYHLAGPIWVDGARVGQTLRVDILDLEPGAWGWCMLIPGLGLLPEEFPESHVRTFGLRNRDSVDLGGGMNAPIAPFLGVMGTHPDADGAVSAFPPNAGGGNVDTRHLTKGTTLWLPVLREGAMFSCGDPHAMQGDGEVCVCALECDMTAVLRLTIENRTIATPMFSTSGPLTGQVDSLGHTATMGLHADLYEGARIAVRAMVDHIAVTRNISRPDAFIAASLIGDLKIFEIVDAGVWNVGFTVPNALLHADIKL